MLANAHEATSLTIYWIKFWNSIFCFAHSLVLPQNSGVRLDDETINADHVYADFCLPVHYVL